MFIIQNYHICLRLLLLYLKRHFYCSCFRFLACNCYLNKPLLLIILRICVEFIYFTEYFVLRQMKKGFFSCKILFLFFLKNDIFQESGWEIELYLQKNQGRTLTFSNHKNQNLESTKNIKLQP